MMSMLTAAAEQTWTAPGKGHFRFHDHAVNRGNTINVYTYRPADFHFDSPILFVMHGTGRNADGYRDQWAEIAGRRGVFIVAPEFDKEQYPEPNSYHLGNVTSKWGIPQPTPEWSFVMIERLFDYVRGKTGSSTDRYLLYGHSAGGQFVHRFVLWMPKARCAMAIAANAGWYTFPDPDIAYPQGLRFVGPATDELKLALSRRLVVMAGLEDDDPNHPQLRRDPQVMFEGRTRLERARNFYARGQRTAARLGCKFGWTLVEVPQVAHSNGGMALAVEKLLFQHQDGTQEE